MEFTIDELTALVLENGRLAMQYRKTAADMLLLADKCDQQAKVYLEAGKRVNREAEEQESKMNIRRIISGVSVLVLIFMVCFVALSSQSRMLAQDVLPVATAEVTAIAPAPAETPAPVDTTNAISVIFDKLITLGLIAAVIALAFKTAGLVPKETFDSALEKGFGILKGLAATSPTPIDDKALEILKPILMQWLSDELAKRAAAPVTPSTLQSGTTPIAPSLTMADLTGGNG